MKFVAAMKQYFGLRPGQASADFLKEIRELDQGDRFYFTRELAKAGIQVTE